MPIKMYAPKKSIHCGRSVLLLVMMMAALQSKVFAQTEPSVPSLPILANGANESVFASVQETYYVAPTGDDNNSGTSSEPFKTFAKGVSKAVQRKNAGVSVKIIIRNGTYREKAAIPPLGAEVTDDTEAAIIIQAQNTGQAIISGSLDWSGQWTQQGSNWTRAWPYDWGTGPAYNGVNATLGRRREIFFVGGVPYRQVLSLGELAAGTYYVDEATDKAYIRPLPGVDLNVALVEVGLLQNLFTINKRKNIAVKGLVFQHEASFPESGGTNASAFRLGKDCQNILLEDVTIAGNNNCGFATFDASQARQDYTFRRVKINHNGGGGMNLFRAQNIYAEDCETSYNRFRALWANQFQGYAAGGFKLSSTHRSTFIRHQAVGNYGRGMWWDIANRDMTAKNCAVDSNYVSGIFDEFNFGPCLIDSCTVVNTKRSATVVDRNHGGLLFASTENLSVKNCTIKNNYTGQIKCWDQQRTMTDHLTGEVKRYDSTNVGHVYLRNNRVESSDTAQSLIDLPDWVYLKNTFNSDNNSYRHAGREDAFRVYQAANYEGDGGSGENYNEAAYYTFARWQQYSNGEANSTFNGVAGQERGAGIVYPANSGIVQMVNAYGLVANDPSKATFNTAQIQKAIDENKGQSFGVRSGILYFPNGTYYVNNKMSLGSVTEDCRYITFQGQSRTGTAIKLADGSAGFGAGANTPLIVFTEASGTNIGFRNYIKNLTIDIGANNPGAIAVDFICNNHGGLFDVTIKSSDSQQRGAIGLKMDRNLGGIGLIKNVRIEGFDIGIKTGSFKINYVFEHLELDGQKVAGIQNTDKPLSIRRLTTTNLKGPAIVNTTAPGHIVLIDSKLGGSGEAAIDNQQGFVFVRNVTTSGYEHALNDHDSLLTGPYIAEYSSGGVYQLWNSSPARSLNLEIKETPEVPWQQDLSKWIVVDVAGNGTEDDAPAIQSAIDSCTAANGKNTVCIRVAKDNAGKVVLKTPIVIRGNVQRFLVLGALFQLQVPLLSANGAVFTLETTNHNELLVEGLQFTAVPQSTGDLTIIQNNSAKTVILRDVATFNGRRYYRNGPSAGALFVEIGGHQFTHPQAGGTVGWEFINQEVWARDINPEDIDVGIVNDGGKLWILGYKFESDITDKPVHHLITKNGGFTEVLGGVDNGVFTENPGSAIHINDNSHVSHISAERARNETQRHTVLIREIRGNAIREFKFGDLPTVSNANFAESSLIPLYVGCKQPQTRLMVSGGPFAACDTVKLTAQVTDFDADASVRFYASGEFIGASDSSGSYGFSWSGMAPGQYALTAEATDSSGNKAASGEITITIEADTTDPVIAVKNPPAVLWPPNHKYHSFKISDFVLSVTDSCAGILPLSGLRITEVTSDEAELAPGSGHTVNDVLIAADCQSVQLRAERQGNGNGRVYTVEVAITDPVGNEGRASYQVQVPPHPGAVARKDAPSYSVACGDSPATSILEWMTKKLANLLSCYPNPFGEQTTIRYYLATPAFVRLDVYNVLGIKVATLVQKQQEAGAHQVILDGTNLQNGLYVGRLQVGSEVQIVQMLLKKERSW